MVNEKIEESSKLTYDERRKLMTQVKTQASENKTEPVIEDEKVTEEAKLISTVKQELNVVYTEAGIRLAYKDLSDQKKFMENRATQLKEQFKDLGELPEDLKKLKENLKSINDFNVAEKAKLDYEGVQIELKDVKKDLAELQEAIGSRLKL